MKQNTKIAGVTGASGLIGRQIVRLLTSNGIRVKALSRKERPSDEFVTFVKGGIEDENALIRLTQGARYLFHCAGERHGPERMHQVNVEGTQCLVKIVRKSSTIDYFCHISSAGVIGQSGHKVIDESCDCRPQNLYEQTKMEAEKIVQAGIGGCRVVLIRPTNVVGEGDLGILAPVFDATLKSRIKLLISSGERTHLVHAENVAAAAIHLMKMSNDKPEVYFISSDHETDTRFFEIENLLNCIKTPGKHKKRRWHLPIIVPYLFRRIVHGKGNMGDIIYSSGKLLSTGYRPPVSVKDTIRRLYLFQCKKQ